MNNFKRKIRLLGLKPTRQRISIMKVLSEKGKTHLTASCVAKLLLKSNIKISTATIYNCLNDLSERGFLNKVIVNKEKMWFDTNLAQHHHYYDSEESQLIDIDYSKIEFSKFPDIPKGKSLDSGNVVINIKNKR